MINFSFGLQHQNCSHHSVSDVYSRPPFFFFAPVIGRWYFLLTLLQKDMSLCAPIQDNQVILVHMPPCISPPAPWPLSSAKSYLPPGLYRVFHSFIIYLQCPTDFSLRWHLTKKNLMVRYFSPCIHLRLTLSESSLEAVEEMDCEQLCSRDIFFFFSPLVQGDYLSGRVLH